MAKAINGVIAGVVLIGFVALLSIGSALAAINIANHHIDNISRLQVVDAETGMPIVGAQIVLSHDEVWVDYQDSSTVEGRFSQRIKGGDYSFWVASRGYETVSGTLYVGFTDQFTGHSDIRFEQGDVVELNGSLVVRMHALAPFDQCDCKPTALCPTCEPPLTPVATPTPYPAWVPTPTPVFQ